MLNAMKPATGGLNIFISLSINFLKSISMGKPLLLIISLTFFLCSSLFAQTGWYSVYSSDTTALQSIFFTNANSGYIAGGQLIGSDYHSLVLKTTNSGSSWSEQMTPQRDSLGFFYRCITFTDVNNGFIAAAHVNNSNIGRILKTTNGGVNWSIVPLPVDKHLTNIFFVNSNTGYASGYQTILKTTDAGLSWIYQNPGFSSYLFEIHFTDVNTGFVCGNTGKILKTTDGGNNWVFLTTATNINLWGLSFTNANTGVAVGGFANGTQNVILRTTDAGNNWSVIPYTYSTCLLWSVEFANSTTGWITGWCGQIIKTTDAGLSWYNQVSNSDEYRTSFFMNANTGYVVGEASGRILKTTDGGGSFVGIEPVINEIPSEFQLYQNYPNPFNPITRIRFDVPAGAQYIEPIQLVVYDILGSEVATLVNEQLKPGTYEVDWNASDYPSGTYFYKLTTGNNSETKKMILIK